MADRAAPTPIAMLIGTAIISVVTGYMLGIASSLGFLPQPFAAWTGQSSSRRSQTQHADSEESSSSEIDDDSILDHAPNWANSDEADRRQGLRFGAKTDKKTSALLAAPKLTEECKLVLVVRTDLGMTKG